MCRRHPGCRVTRSATDPVGARLFTNPGQGRPVGYMAAWLAAGAEPGWGDGTPKGKHSKFKPARADRIAARTIVTGSEVGRELCRCERDIRPDRGEEGEEPNSPI